MNPIRRLDAWAKTWSRSQLVFLYATAAAFIAALACQAHVIAVLTEHIKHLKP